MLNLPGNLPEPLKCHCFLLKTTSIFVNYNAFKFTRKVYKTGLQHIGFEGTEAKPLITKADFLIFKCWFIVLKISNGIILTSAPLSNRTLNFLFSILIISSYALRYSTRLFVSECT